MKSDNKPSVPTSSPAPVATKPATLTDINTVTVSKLDAAKPIEPNAL